jgi:hypothetical protein
MALPLLLGAAKGLIGSGKKKPKSGKAIAEKVVQRKEQKDAKKPSTQKKLAPAQVSGKKFFGGKSSTPKIKKLKPNTGNSQLDNVLQSIQSSISKLAGTIRNFVKFKRKDGEEKTKRKNKMLARLREVGFGMIGGVLSLGKKLLSKIPFFDRIKNFFVNILLGGLVLMILDNIKPIIETIKDVVKKVKTVFKLINKYLFQPMIEAGKFLIKNILPIVTDIINSPPVDFVITQIESLIKTLQDNFPQLEEISKNIESSIEEIKNIQLPGYDPNNTDGSQYDTSSGGLLAEGGVEQGTKAKEQVSQAGFGESGFLLYRDTVAQIESGGEYDIQGGSGNMYAGRYQMGADARKDAARFLGEEYQGDSEAARKTFREDKQMQERYFAAYTRANHEYLMKGSPEYVELSKEGKLQVLGYAHNAGWSRAADWLKSGMSDSFRDGFGTRSDKYSTAIRSAQEQRRSATSVPPALRSQSSTLQPGKSRVQTDIEEFRQFRTQFGYTSERKPTLNPENLQIREMGTYGSGNYDISPLADDTNYEINEHKGAGHHENRAFDIPVPSKAVGDKVNQFWKSKGYTTIWQSAGHYNHVHVEVPKNKAAEFFNIAPEQPQVAPPAERQTAEDISKQTDYEKMRTIFMPIAVPSGESGGNSGSGGGSPTVIGSGSAKDTYLQIMMENKLFKQ